MADSICVLAATELGLNKLKEVDAYTALHKGCVHTDNGVDNNTFVRSCTSILSICLWPFACGQSIANPFACGQKVSLRSDLCSVTQTLLRTYRVSMSEMLVVCMIV